MANANSTNGDRIPKVRIAKPGKRPYQLRYTVDAKKKQEVRISTGTHDEAEALRLKAELEAKLTSGLPANPNGRETGCQGRTHALGGFQGRVQSVEGADVP